MNHKRLLAEIAGWYGAFAIICAYSLASFNVVEPESLIYQLLNFTGALGIAVIATVKRVTQSIVLNLFWAAIALVALVRVAFQ